MQQANDILRVILLGTGIPNPDINAFGTATIIEAGSQRVLLDCGRGTVIRLGLSTRCSCRTSIPTIMPVFLTC